MYQIPLSALNEGQHLPFRRQGCKKCATELAPVSMPGWALSVSGPVPWLSQHPWASRGTLVVFSPFHTNFNLSFKSWVVFFFFFSFSLFKILFLPFMLIPFLSHPTSTCCLCLFHFGLEVVTWITGDGNALPCCALVLPNSLWKSKPDVSELLVMLSWTAHEGESYNFSSLERSQEAPYPCKFNHGRPTWLGQKVPH